MLTAQQARELMDSSKQIAKDLNNVLACIEQSAKESRNYFWVTSYLFTEDQLNQLKELGYTVTIDKQNDYKITW